jgi:hypothetical protein
MRIVGAIVAFFAAVACINRPYGPTADMNWLFAAGCSAIVSGYATSALAGIWSSAERAAESLRRVEEALLTEQATDASRRIVKGRQTHGMVRPIGNDAEAKAAPLGPESQ